MTKMRNLRQNYRLKREWKRDPSDKEVYEEGIREMLSDKKKKEPSHHL